MVLCGGDNIEHEYLLLMVYELNECIYVNMYMYIYSWLCVYLLHTTGSSSWICDIYIYADIDMLAYASSFLVIAANVKCKHSVVVVIKK